MRSINNLIKLTLLTATIFLIGSCTTQHKIQTFSNNLLIRDTGLLQSHVGIALYDPSTRKNLYTFQSDKLFTPASNTKILSCYAAMKYLPNLLPAAYITDLDTAVVITPTGDPSFLQPDFNTHPLFDKLKSINKPLYIINNN